MQLSGREGLELLTNDIVELSNIKEPASCKVDKGFLNVCRLLNSRFLNYRMPDFEDRDIIPLKYEHTDVATVLFSGGKVSLAEALWLKDMGKDIELLYFIDKNKDKVIELMTKLPFKFTVIYEEIPSNDFAGMMMIHSALKEAIRSGKSPIIYTGCFEYATVDINKRKNWRYCNDFISTYSDIITKYVDGVKVLGVMPNYTVVNNELLKHPEYQYV